MTSLAGSCRGDGKMRKCDVVADRGFTNAYTSLVTIIISLKASESKISAFVRALSLQDQYNYFSGRKGTKGNKPFLRICDEGNLHKFDHF